MRASTAAKGRLERRVQVHPVRSWEALDARLAEFGAQWAFRGMGSDAWRLQTSLERLETVPVLEAERYLLTTFQRRAHHYLTDLPGTNEHLEWLALMQHHGAPTRLLDCTKSPYVALYFAFESWRSDVERCALWAFDLDGCKRESLRIAGGAPVPPPEPGEPTPTPLDPEESLGQPGIFYRVFLKQRLRLVAPLQPFRMNQRLTIQQGLFLCPGDLGSSFEGNLLAFGKQKLRRSVQKIVIPTQLRTRILRRLNKMNINRATLFPGIDGFAQSLAANVQIATDTGRLSRELQKLSIYTDWGFL